MLPWNEDSAAVRSGDSLIVSGPDRRTLVNDRVSYGPKSGCSGCRNCATRPGPVRIPNAALPIMIGSVTAPVEV